MKIFIDAARAPLRHVHPSQRDRKEYEYLQAMAKNGLHPVEFNSEEGSISVNIRNFEKLNPGENPRVALRNALEAIGAARVDLEERDVPYLFGTSDEQKIAAHTIAKGLRDGDHEVTKRLSSLEIGEVADAVHDAFQEVCGRPLPTDPALRAHFLMSAEADLISHGLLKPSQPDPGEA